MTDSTAESKKVDSGADDSLPEHTKRWTLGKRKRFQNYVSALEERAADKSGQHQHREDWVGEGDPVILEHSKGRLFAEAGRGKRVRVHKDMFAMDGVMDSPFGSYFAAEKGKFVRNEAPDTEVDTKITEALIPTANNSELVDDGAHQTLTQDEIKELKKQGKSPQEIIDIIAKSSTTFAGKTEFSQEKYLKRKKKKYSNLVRALKPTAKAVAETYLVKHAAKTMMMRADSLAQMLVLANVRAGAQAMVIENCGGLLTAAVAERVGGHGAVLNGCGSAPVTVAAEDGSAVQTTQTRFSDEAMKKFRLSPAAARAVLHFPLSAVGAAIKARAAVKLAEPAAAEPAEGPTAGSGRGSGSGAAAMDLSSDSAAAAPAAAAESKGEHKGEQKGGKGGRGKRGGKGGDAGGKGGDSKDGGSGKERKSFEERARERAAAEAQSMQLLSSGHTDALLIACWWSPLDVLLAALPLLAHSGAFAVYSPHAQPLVVASEELTRRGLAVQVQLTESFCREHQVLPGRTHPVMKMQGAQPGTGGYILSGIKVSTAPAT